MNKLIKRGLALIFSVIFALSASSCQGLYASGGVQAGQAPAAEAQQEEAQSAPDPLSPGDAGGEGTPMRADFSLSEDFISLDGAAEISLRINESGLYTDSFPVIRVTPHEITDDEAAHIERVLFGGLPIWESSLSNTPTGDAARSCANEWRRIATDEELLLLYGEGRFAEAKSFIMDSISSMDAAGMHADGAAPGAANDLLFHWAELPSPEALQQDSAPAGGSGQDVALIRDGELSYKYCVTRESTEDYSVQSIRAAICSEYSSPWDIETLHMIKTVCSASAPTQAQLSSAQERAEGLIEALDIGEWAISSCEAEVYKYWRNEDMPAYVISIKAVPVYGGVESLLLPQLEELGRSRGAAGYYYSALEITLSPDGHFVEMEYTSPLDIMETVSADAATIDLRRAVDALAGELEASGAAFFGDTLGMPPGGKISACVDKMRVGMARIPAEDAADAFYIIPAVQLCGDYEIESGGITESYRALYGRDMTFAVISLIDGSLINPGQSL